MRLALAGALLLAAVSAQAEEPHGCDKLKWPLDVERTALGGDVATAANGAELTMDPIGHALALVPLDGAGLATAPERNRGGSATKAAFARYPAPAGPSTIQVTVSGPVWIDLVQEGRTVRPKAFSGALDCANLRKSMRFPVAAKPFVLQFSGAGIDSVKFAVTPATP